MAPREQVVMGKYVMFMDEASITGEGTSSICRNGVVKATKEPVAIKVYKTHKRKSMDKDNLKKFIRQVRVLQELEQPFVPPDDASLWSDELAATEPKDLFMHLIDFSKDASGNPAPDPTDGVMYLVTELGSYSLKDYIRQCRSKDKRLSRTHVLEIIHRILLLTAGLHAKGLVHLDLKPENLMLFGGQLKLIDVDGCVKKGAVISISDSSLSFSPCYCAPEWANFLIDDVDDPVITSAPALDVWSIGMTVCELITLEPVLRKTYASFMRNGLSQREAGFYFMDWLATLRIIDVPIPPAVGKLDPQLLHLVSGHLLSCDPGKRSTMCTALSHPVFAKDKQAEASALEKISEDDVHTFASMPQPSGPRRKRVEDESEKTRYKNKLWVLAAGAKIEDSDAWSFRDVWIHANGSICCFDEALNKSNVMIDGHHAHDSHLEKITSDIRPFSFKIVFEDNDQHIETVFSCDKAEDMDSWLHEIEQSKLRVMQTMHLGKSVAGVGRKFRVAAQNRRKAVGDEPLHDFQAKFQDTLWKVKTNGDMKKVDNWLVREMWLAANGSLVYHSKRDCKELIYYTADDMARATISVIDDQLSCMPFSFQVALPPVDGVEIAPGIFAARSQEQREYWMKEMANFHKD
eukprot:TRINITY_DN18963_c0_g1_i1.p1 TRINITY_DN18963_c0_g1~~TRINITY_DN18963_c0_g1_i1.p1  ORF type:complete len:632 (-),score=97.23 TRINITY_DN18963_c0_g1_i1:175-2070(-)